jgi:hypothetical protein
MVLPEREGQQRENAARPLCAEVFMNCADVSTPFSHTIQVFEQKVSWREGLKKWESELHLRSTISLGRTTSRRRLGP